MSEPPKGRADPLLHDHVAVLRLATMFWAAAASLFVLVAVPATRDAVQSLDDFIQDVALNVEWEPAVVLARVLDTAGGGVVTIPLRIVVALWLGLRRRFEALAVWVLAATLSEPVIGILKSAYARVRPPASLVETTGYSFPSGHAVAGTVIAVSLVIVLVPPGAARRNLELLAVGFTFLMALSRVYLRAHWFSDAAAGVAFGAAVTLLVAAVAHEVNDRIHGTGLSGRSP